MYVGFERGAPQRSPMDRNSLRLCGGRAKPQELAGSTGNNLWKALWRTRGVGGSVSWGKEVDTAGGGKELWLEAGKGDGQNAALI